MKNVIIFICDSLVYNDDFFTNMPGLESFRKNMIIFDNFYAQAPFTDAAVVPLFTATNVLDYGGYFNNLKGKPYNINEIFQGLGYFTYNTLWAYSNTYSFLRGVDSYQYMDGAITTPLNRYRIQYFKELYKKKQFSETHIKMLIELLDDFFKMSQIFANHLVNNEEKFDLLRKYTQFNNLNVTEFVITEQNNRNKYYANKIKYIKDLLEDKNTFFKNRTYSVNYSNEFKMALPKITKITNKTIIKQFGYSLVKGFKNNSYSTLINTIRNYKKEGKTINTFKKWVGNIIKFGRNYNTEFLSANIIFEHFLCHLKNNSMKNNFAIVHINDNHAPLNFFSKEEGDIEAEIKDFERITKASYKKGNVFYNLSQNYIDRQITNFICKLENENMLEDTTIIITADHGSSYVGHIFRDEITTTFFDENYRIPLVIFNKNIEGSIVSNYGSMPQFIPTLLDYLNVDKYKGWIENESLFRRNKQEVIFEYYGPGCPDYSTRDKLYCIRNNHYKISYKVEAGHDINDGEVISIYDIINDPLEKKDIKNKSSHDKEIEELLATLKTQRS